MTLARTPPGTNDVTVTGAGAAADAVALAAAVAQLNTFGEGRLLIDGHVIQTAQMAFTGAVTIEGLGPNATLDIRVTGETEPIVWNSGYDPIAETTYAFTQASDHADYFSTSATTLADGEYVIMWAGDVLPDNASFDGANSSYMMELHEVYEWDAVNTRAYTAGPIINRHLTTPLFCKVTPSTGIQVKNLEVLWGSGTPPDDETMAFTFYKCAGVRISNVRFTRQGAGGFQFNYCWDCEVDGLTMRGMANTTTGYDYTYGVVASVCNGVRVTKSHLAGAKNAFLTKAATTGSDQRGICLNCVVDGNTVLIPVLKEDDTPTLSARTGLLAAAESYGTVFSDNDIYLSGSLANVGIQSNGRDDVIVGNRIYGGHLASTGLPTTQIGIQVAGPALAITGNTVDRCGYGIVTTTHSADYQVYCVNQMIGGNTITNCRLNAIVARGDGTNIFKNKIHSCASATVAEPLQTKSLIQLGATTTRTVDSVSGTTVTLTASHTFPTSLQVRFRTTDTLPTGLTVGTYYWIVAVAGSTLDVSATKGGAAISLSGGAGTHYVDGYVPPKDCIIEGNIGHKGSNDTFLGCLGVDTDEVKVIDNIAMGYGLGTSIFDDTFSGAAAMDTAWQNRNTVDDVVAGSGGYQRGTISVESTDGSVAFYEPTADTRAARGITLAAVVTAAAAGDIIHLAEGCDYEGVDFIFDEKVILYGHNSSIVRPTGTDYTRLLRFDGDYSECHNIRLISDKQANANGTGAGLSITADGFWGSGIYSYGHRANGNTNGYGIYIYADRVTIESSRIEECYYAGIYHYGDLCVYRDIDIINMVGSTAPRSFNSGDTTDKQRLELSNVRAFATIADSRATMNFNSTGIYKTVLLDRVYIRTDDLISAGVSFDQSDRTQCAKFQNIEDLRLTNCHFDQGSNDGDGVSTATSVGFAFDDHGSPNVSRMSIDNCYFSGYLQFSNNRLDSLTIKNSDICARHGQIGRVLRSISSAHTTIENCHMQVWDSDFGEYGIEFLPMEIAYTSGDDAGGAPSAGETVTGGTSGAIGEVTSIETDSGDWTIGTAAGTVNLFEVSGTFQATEALTFSGGGTATGGAITGTLGSDSLRFMNNEIISTENTTAYAFKNTVQTLRGNIVSHGNTLTNSGGGTLTLCETAAGIALLEDRVTYNVRDHGATGDGSTDDTDSIQDAVDSAGSGIVLFPPGYTFYMASTVTPTADMRIEATGATIKGGGVDSNADLFTATAAIDISVNGGHYKDCRAAFNLSSSFLDFRARGAKFSDSVMGIMMTSASSPTFFDVEGCEFDSVELGIDLQSSTIDDVRVSNNRFIGIEYKTLSLRPSPLDKKIVSGFWYQSTSGTTSCICSDNYVNGVTGPTGAAVPTENEVHGLAVTMSDSAETDCVMDGNIIRDVTGDTSEADGNEGIMGRAKRVVISNGVYYDCGDREGLVYAKGSEYHKVAGNIIEVPTSHPNLTNTRGVISTGDDADISNNKFINVQYGIYSRALKATYADNEFINCGDCAIALALESGVTQEVTRVIDNYSDEDTSHFFLDYSTPPGETYGELIFQDNTVKGPGRFAVLKGGDNVIIENNFIERTGDGSHTQDDVISVGGVINRLYFRNNIVAAFEDHDDDGYFLVGDGTNTPRLYITDNHMRGGNVAFSLSNETYTDVVLQRNRFDDVTTNLEYASVTVTGTEVIEDTATEHDTSSPFSVLDYGATGDGSTDDRDAIQATIDAAEVAGGTVFVPIGNYLISSGLTIAANDVTLEGEGWGSVIENDPTQGTEFNTIIVDNKSNVVIRNLQFDGRVDERSGTDDPKGCIFLQNGCQNCTIENVLAKDFGHHTTPGGNVFTIDCTESASRNTSGNRIEHCQIEDSGTAQFGIRVTTEWDVDVADSAYTRFCRDNVIRDNIITGVSWNAIEIAGPATLHNTITGNKSIGCLGVGGIECDKGAGWNTLSDNIVVDAVPEQSAAFAGFRDQGFTGGAYYDRYARGNVWENCIVRNCTQETSETFIGFEINYSTGVRISNVIIEDNVADVPGTYADMYGFNIYDASSVSIRSAYIREVLDGIKVVDTVVGLDVSGADIDSKVAGYCVRFTDDTTSVILTGCRFAGGANGVGIATASKTVTGGIISGCQFFTHTYAAINVDASSCEWIGVISGNYFDADITGGLLVRAQDWSKFGFFANYYTDGSTPGSEHRAFIYANARDGGTNLQGNRAMSWDDAAPTAGTWVKGDTVWNSDPAGGEYVGWICITAGTPGTWKGFGALEA